MGQDNCLFIHVTLVPYIKSAGESKTKPTQHSVKELRSIGIQPDIIVCRSDRPLAEDIRKKISLFCNVENEAVILNSDTPILYQVPLLLHQQNLDAIVCHKLGISAPPPELEQWRQMVNDLENPKDKVEIALVGKYIQLHDAYLSIVEALTHGGVANNLEVKIRWVNAEDLEGECAGEQIKWELGGVDGIIVPDGSGRRGLLGKIAAIEYARVKDIPFLGISLGMQMAVVEFSRNIMGYKDAHSTAIMPHTPYPVIDIIEDQREINNKGGTMRLGSYPCRIFPGSLADKAYGKLEISERHRHRYEFNNKYRRDLESAGLLISGVNPQKNLVEIIELPEKRWFMGVQFHPEFKSRPNRAHPLFRDFIEAAYKYHKL